MHEVIPKSPVNVRNQARFLLVTTSPAFYVYILYHVRNMASHARFYGVKLPMPDTLRVQYIKWLIALCSTSIVINPTTPSFTATTLSFSATYIYTLRLDCKPGQL